MSEETKTVGRWKRINNRVAHVLASFARRYPRSARFLGIMHKRRRPVFVLILVFFHIVGFFCSIQAVMQVRTEQGAVAWAMALNTVPVAAVPGWLVFGDSRLDGYVSTRRAGHDMIRPVEEKLLETFRVAEVPVENEESGYAVHTMSRLASMPWTRGNEVEVLIDGEQTFDSIFEVIDQAEEYILVEYYIFRDDDVGSEFQRRLIEKAKAGVDVYVVLDNFGCLKLPDEFFEEMRAAGIQAKLFMDVSGEANRFQLNFRNHRKIVVVDGKTGFVGGLNVGDEYLGKHEKLTPWRDTHMRIEGPAVKAIQVAFAEDWHWATGEILEQLAWAIEPEDLKGESNALIIPSGPSDPMETCSMFFLSAIQGAKERIWIASPYFVPDDKIVTALQMAAIRGVDVRVMMPDLSDGVLVKLSSYSYLRELDRAGVKMYRYKKGFLHQKVLVMDDDIAAIGSANFDNRSFRLNFEITGVVQDPVFAGKVSAMLEEDFENCERTGAEDYSEKHFLFRLAVRVARMLAPIQ